MTDKNNLSIFTNKHLVTAKFVALALAGIGSRQQLRPGSVVLASATVLLEYAERLGQRLAERGILLIDAPLSGGAAKAAHGAMGI